MGSLTRKARAVEKPTVKEMNDYCVEVTALVMQYEKELDALRPKVGELERELKRALWAAYSFCLTSLGLLSYLAWSIAK